MEPDPETRRGPGEHGTGAGPGLLWPGLPEPLGIAHLLVAGLCQLSHRLPASPPRPASHLLGPEEPHLSRLTSLSGSETVPGRRLLLTGSSHSLSRQVGSYFGGELCGVDTDRDGEAELLLVGAPLFYGAQRGGRVFVYERKQVGAGPGAEGRDKQFSRRPGPVVLSLSLWDCV